jgi:maltoporin
MSKKNLGRKLATPLGAALLMFGAVGQSAWASDEAGEFHGYFRVGAGSNSDKGSQACFGLEGVSKYRFGNECDFYAEFAYTKELAKSSNGASFVGTVMANSYSPTSDVNDANLRINQLFIEAKNLDFLGGGIAWVGKRFYLRPDIHVLDFKYVQGDGVGAGVDGIKAGPGKFSYGLFRNDVDQKVSATRHNFSYADLPVTADGTLRFDATVISADSSVAGNNNGWSLSTAFTQGKLLGGDNMIALQYGVGPGVKIGGTGDLRLNSDYTRVRVVDQFVWQVTPNFGGTADFVIQRDKSNAGASTWTSIGTRPVYAIHENVKLQLDIGHDEIKPAGGGPTQKLTKITFAPTLGVGRNFWSRPELRAFITYAKWNDAAQAAATPGTTLSTTGSFGANTSGRSIGVQVESWF